MEIGPSTARYAKSLQILSYTGMGLLIATFLLYILEVLPTSVPPERVAELWHLDAATFTEVTGRAVGWKWVTTIFTGDGLAFGSLIFLAIGVIFCMLILIPSYAKRKNTAYLVIVTCETIVLTVAASGILLTR